MVYIFQSGHTPIYCFMRERNAPLPPPPNNGPAWHYLR